MPRPPMLLGVDVGGTTMAAGVVTPQGEVLLEESVPTYRDGPGSAIRTLVDLITKTRAAAEQKGHAISASASACRGPGAGGRGGTAGPGGPGGRAHRRARYSRPRPGRAIAGAGACRAVRRAGVRGQRRQRPRAGRGDVRSWPERALAR